MAERDQQRVHSAGPQVEDDFDFFRDVVGDDLVVNGAVHSSDVYTQDGEGGIRTPTDEEQRRWRRLAGYETDDPPVLRKLSDLDRERRDETAGQQLYLDVFAGGRAWDGSTLGTEQMRARLPSAASQTWELTADEERHFDVDDAKNGTDEIDRLFSEPLFLKEGLADALKAPFVVDGPADAYAILNESAETDAHVHEAITKCTDTLHGQVEALTGQICATACAQALAVREAAAAGGPVSGQCSEASAEDGAEDGATASADPAADPWATPGNRLPDPTKHRCAEARLAGPPTGTRRPANRCGAPDSPPMPIPGGCGHDSDQRGHGGHNGRA